MFNPFYSVRSALKARSATLLAILPLAVASGQTPATAAEPLARAHAHNDYEHDRPLLDALDNGFCSVEADIYLIDGELLVAHDRDKVQSGRTLEKLYLGPLAARVKANAGRVYPNGPGFTLLIDFKSEAESTYAALQTELERHANMLTRFTPDSTEPGAVTVVISGSRPRATMAAQASRLASVDGRLGDLETDVSVHQIELVSDNWRSHFKWRGIGAFPAEEKSKLAEIVRKTHAQGRRLRLWATPDRPEVWQTLHEAGVDLINTDNLTGLRDFLLSKEP